MCTIKGKHSNNGTGNEIYSNNGTGNESLNLVYCENLQILYSNTAMIY